MGRKITKQEKRLRRARRESREENARQDKSLDDFVEKFSASRSNETVLKNASENLYGVKVSEALREVCEPALGDSSGTDVAREIFTLGAIAWNLECSVDELAGEEDIATLAKEMAIAVDEMDDDRKAIFLDSVSLFFRRKRERFPNVKCLIVDYEVVEVDGKWRLNVATTPLQ